MRIVALLLALFMLSFVLVGCIGASCKAQELRGFGGTCATGPRGFMWTGTSCIYTVACNCTGPDCQRLYSTQNACEAAHVHCR
ncbi:MAG: hypothetical protein JST00_30995 [Deltaproteobacteria bacterium]|nr:hypothetical protein [Deltaproteobacteria bacterium]